MRVNLKVPSYVTIPSYLSVPARTGMFKKALLRSITDQQSKSLYSSIMCGIDYIGYLNSLLCAFGLIKFRQTRYDYPD